MAPPVASSMADGKGDDARNWNPAMPRYLTDYWWIIQSSFIRENSRRKAADDANRAQMKTMDDFEAFRKSSFIKENSRTKAGDDVNRDQMKTMKDFEGFIGKSFGAYPGRNAAGAQTRGLTHYEWMLKSSFIEENSRRKAGDDANRDQMKTMKDFDGFIGKSFGIAYPGRNAAGDQTRLISDNHPHSETTGRRPGVKPIASFDDDSVSSTVPDVASNENILSIVKTIIFSDGKCMSEVNSLSDAIIHCRSGCGKPVNAGPRLIAEMEADKTLHNYMVKSNSHVESVAAAKVREVAWGQKKGTLSFTEKSQVFNCQTLGGYVGNLAATVDYNCSYSGNTRTCNFTGKGVLTGKDIWDFESHPEWPLWKNMIREILPSFLVSLRGKMKEFDINFNVTRSFSGTVGK